MSNSPKILFCGDPHQHFDHIITAIETHHPAAVILLGDMEFQADLREIFAHFTDLCQIRLIPGNHDTDNLDEFLRVFGPGLSEFNLDGRVEKIAGIRIAGLGGVFRSSIWDGVSEPLYRSFADLEAHEKTKPHWKQKRYQPGGAEARNWANFGELRKHRSSIFPDTIEKMSRLQADVLICHEAPGGHKNGFAAIDGLAAAMGVKTIIHGHHHQDYSTLQGGIAVRGVGFCGIIDQDGKIIRQGDFENG